MKKFLMFTSIPLLITSGYLLYKINGLNEKLAAFEEKNKQQVSDCFSCGDTSGRKPFDYLEVATLKDMASAYQGIVRRRVTQSSGNTVEDASSIWFSLDALKSFIWEIQKDTCGKKDCEGKPLELGVRIYYARYPQFNLQNTAGGLRYPDIQAVNKDYENLHTVFMIPTYDSSGYQKDFDPRYYDEKNNCPKTIVADTWPASQRILALTPNNYTAQNHGGLCPPLTNCKGTAFQK